MKHPMTREEGLLTIHDPWGYRKDAKGRPITNGMPYWIYNRFRTKCLECKITINVGELIVYDPAKHKCYCHTHSIGK